jgi:hypothetical protein
MEILDLDGSSLPNVVWISIKFKSYQAAKFVPFTQNKNYKHPRAAKKIGIV